MPTDNNYQQLNVSDLLDSLNNAGLPAMVITEDWEPEPEQVLEPVPTISAIEQKRLSNLRQKQREAAIALIESDFLARIAEFEQAHGVLVTSVHISQGDSNGESTWHTGAYSGIISLSLSISTMEDIKAAGIREKENEERWASQQAEKEAAKKQSYEKLQAVVVSEMLG